MYVFYVVENIGVILQYSLVSTITWWIFHVVSIFYKVMFPLTARKRRKKEKFVHLLLLSIGVWYACIKYTCNCSSISSYIYNCRSHGPFTSNHNYSHSEEVWLYDCQSSSPLYMSSCQRLFILLLHGHRP